LEKFIKGNLDKFNIKRKVDETSHYEVNSNKSSTKIKRNTKIIQTYSKNFLEKNNLKNKQLNKQDENIVKKEIINNYVIESTNKSNYLNNEDGTIKKINKRKRKKLKNKRKICY
jgi:hypothetical protein